MLALVKGNREPHEVKEKPFDLGGNRTHDLRISFTVTLTLPLLYRYEPEAEFLCPASWLRRQSNGRSNPEVVGSIPPRSKDFFFTSCGSLIPFTRAKTQ